MVRRTLFIARGQAPPLLEPIDQPLHLVPFSVDRAVEWPATALVGLAGDRDADAASPQVRPDLPAAVALVAHDPLRTQAGPPAARPLDRPLRHELREGGRLMALARGEHEGDGLAVALAANVDLGAEAALAPAEGFRRWVPFFAPAACW